jgi:hypothetical protein
MVLARAAQLAISLFEHGWQTIIICGNSLFDPADTAPVLIRLCPVAEVYHITLPPPYPPYSPAVQEPQAATRPGSQPMWSCWHASHIPAQPAWTTRT